MTARGDTQETDAFNERVINGDELHAPCVHPLGTIDYCTAYGLALDEMERLERARDAALSAIKAHEAVRDACFEALPECQVWGDVPGHIEALRKERDAAMAALRWIPVAERLPEDNSPVLVWQGDASHTKRTASYLFGKWYWTDSEYSHPCKPEAWMPIPQYAAPQDDGGSR